MRIDLVVLASGMTTAVGLTAPATCSAFRARLDNFQETHFVVPGGERLIAAEAPLEQPWRGLARLARLLEGPLRECLDEGKVADASRVPLLLSVAEPDRAGRFATLDRQIVPELTILLGTSFHEASRLIPHGRVGGAVALREAHRLVHEEGVERVMIAGVDSYLVGDTVRAYGEARRLLAPDNSDGFIPGEAGAAVLVGPAKLGGDLVCRSLGFALEQATIASEEPLRGDGLRQAFEQALAAAGLSMADIGYRLGAMSGEQYWFKEFELATSRLLRDRHEFMDLWHPADAIGEIGAAVVPCLLGIALEAARKQYAPGDPVLLSISNDDKRRSAIVATGRAG